MRSEKEKMLNGELYVSFGEELFNERQYAKEKLFEFNNLNPNEVEKRNLIIKELFGYAGKNFYIEPPFRADYGKNIYWGDNSYCNYNCVILDCAKVTIGNDVLIGPNVGIYAAGHPIDPEERKSGLEYAYPVTIGDGAWIGGGSTINGGVTIGENSIIGAGSVVIRDIPKNVVACGNPCRVIREITEEDKMIKKV